LFERTRQSARLDAVTKPIEKEQINSCVLKHLFWREFSNKKIFQSPGNLSTFAAMTPIDKEQVNSCVLKHLFWREFSNKKNLSNPLEIKKIGNSEY